MKMKNAGNSENSGQSEGQILGYLEPWSELVDGANLLNSLTAAIRQYVVLDDGAAEAVALWVLHTHALEAFLISPRLAITSVVMRCGKTTLVDVLSRLVRSPLTTVNATAAAIFRLVHAYQPTLLIDEADTFLTKNSDLRGILNSGYRRNSAYVIRADAIYSTWAPVAVAMIGRLPSTLEDRAIAVRLKRRRQDEVIAPFRFDQTDGLGQLGRMAARWAADNLEKIKNTDPAMPTTLQNREADNWRPLLAIADVAGGEWSNRARRIAQSLAASNRESEQSAGIMLLEDIALFFNSQEKCRVSSNELALFLKGLEGRSWSESKGGKAITQKAIANLLAPFDITPIEMRVGHQVLRGYQMEQFEDAFARYVPGGPAQSATPLHAA
jgi:putative DNA primase/helicase